MIFEFALRENTVHDSRVAVQERRTKRHPGRNESWEWSIYHATAAPFATYLNLMECNRQLASEIKDFIQRSKDHEPGPAKMEVIMDYPSITTKWTHIPGPPEQTTTLAILVKVDHMYHPVFISQGPHNAILTIVFELLNRYIHRGPHLIRRSALRQPLKLEDVYITLAPPMPFEDMTFVYGFPEQQLESLFNEFQELMRRLGRSGIPFGSVRTFNVRMDGRDWHRMPVTSNVWDEEDYSFFRNAGFLWDAGEA